MSASMLIEPNVEDSVQFTLVISTSSRSTTLGMPVFFLTMFLPFLYLASLARDSAACSFRCLFESARILT